MKSLRSSQPNVSSPASNSYDNLFSGGGSLPTTPKTNRANSSYQSDSTKRSKSNENLLRKNQSPRSYNSSQQQTRNLQASSSEPHLNHSRTRSEIDISDVTDDSDDE